MSDEQEALNIEHADNPREGDLWVERLFHRICVVRAVGSDFVTCDWDFGPPKGGRTMTRAAFSEYVRYPSIPNKTWCDCRPARAMSEA